MDMIVKHLFEHPEEVPGYGAILGMAYYLFKIWLSERKEKLQKIRVESKIEEHWEHGDDTLPGSKNPGRTLPQLVELVHEDLQQHKAETNRRFDKIHEDLGKIKGKLDI